MTVFNATVELPHVGDTELSLSSILASEFFGGLVYHSFSSIGHLSLFATCSFNSFMQLIAVPLIGGKVLEFSQKLWRLFAVLWDDFLIPFVSSFVIVFAVFVHSCSFFQLVNFVMFIDSMAIYLFLGGFLAGRVNADIYGSTIPILCTFNLVLSFVYVTRISYFIILSSLLSNAFVSSMKTGQWAVHGLAPLLRPFDFQGLGAQQGALWVQAQQPLHVPMPNLFRNPQEPQEGH